MLKELSRYFDFSFYLRFAGLFLLFYLTYTFVVAASAPAGVYYPFVEQYLNFPVLIRHGVLNTGHFALSLLGYPTTLVDDRIVAADGVSVLQMAWACYGLGLKSFWVAFVCAHSLTLRKKILWSLLGVFTVFVLNCVRVVVLMIATVNQWAFADYMGTNNHDLFNYVCYAALLGLIFLFYAKAKPVSERHGFSKRSVRSVV